jgi:PAS domain S-box-containing protein
MDLPEPPEIADPHQSLERLREDAEKYQLLIEATDTGFVILDGEGRVLDANAEYVKLTGHAGLDEIVGRPVTEWTADADRERNAEEVRRCTQHGRVRNLEIDYVDRDGRLTPIEINATVQQGPAGVRIFTVCRDISERRRAERALRSSEQRYRATIDAMGEAIHVVDDNLRIQLLNAPGQRWLEQLGISGDIVGQRIFDVFPFLPDEVRDEYARVFAGEGPLVTMETSIVAGREVSTETRKVPVVEGGRVVRVVTIIQDRSDFVRVEERLRQTEKMKALGQLAGGVAHDFNNQLAGVLGYAELIASRVDDPEQRDYAEAIVEIARRSAHLTGQLLAFAHKGKSQSVRADVHTLIGDVVRMLARTLDPRIMVCSRLDAPSGVTTGDPAQLQSALLNLALNARDAMPEGGVLTFATDVVEPDAEFGGDLSPALAAGPYLRVRVSDTGVGMTEEVRRRLFEPFFTTKGPGHGTGLGLAAVYGTVTRHHGAIGIDSAVGQGTTVTVVLPLVEDARVPHAPAFGEAPARGTGHVLLAEDDPSVCKVLAETLRAGGYRVTTYADGASALSYYREAWREIDLVVLDVSMPVLGGPGALVEMRRVNPAVRAILCSAQPLGTPAPDGVAFLQKPFAMAELIRCAASLLADTPQAERMHLHLPE